MTRDEQAAELFARRKAEPVMRALVSNLRTAGELPYLVSADARPMRGVPAFIVGAAPSLSASLSMLEQCSDVGYVFAVNASARAVSTVTTPDVLVVRESIDVSAQLDGVRAGLVALDACASPAVWAAAESVGRRGWYMPAAVQYFAIAGLLGVRPVYGGPSAVTAAVALAHAWGASPIVLVGCDLAFAKDGQGYAAESSWGNVRGSVSGDLVHLDGMETMRAVVESSGQHAPPTEQSVERFPAWGGVGEVSSLLTWGDQVRWLENFAARHDDVVCINASGAGARINGWSELAFGDVYASPHAALDIGGSRVDTRPALTALDHDARRALDAGTYLSTGVLEAMSASRVLAARDGARTAAERIRGVQDAHQASAEWTLDALK